MWRGSTRGAAQWLSAAAAGLSTGTSDLASHMHASPALLIYPVGSNESAFVLCEQKCLALDGAQCNSAREKEAIFAASGDSTRHTSSSKILSSVGEPKLARDVAAADLELAAVCVSYFASSHRVPAWSMHASFECGSSGEANSRSSIRASGSSSYHHGSC